MFSYDWVGRDSQIRVSVTHEWSASWRADHGKHDVELGRRASKLAQAVLGSPGPQGAATNVPPLCGRTDRAWRILQHRRLTKVRREKKINGPPPEPTLPAIRHAIVGLIIRTTPQQCPNCRMWISTQSSVSKSAKVVLGR